MEQSTTRPSIDTSTRSKCSHCGKSGHKENRCWIKNPGLKKAHPKATLKPFDVAPALTSMQVNGKAYLSTHPNIGRVVSSCLIFQDNTVLLLERTKWKPAQTATWEIPGGLCDASDQTLLHSAARETLEETGLNVKRFNHQVGSGYRIEVKKHSKNGPRTFLKVVFDADIEEAISGDGNFTHRVPRRAFRLSREHSRWTWATEEQVRAERVGEIDLALKIVEKEILLDGFALRKAGVSS
jgi:8-oxo-dGTP pyrophosphatase MutT (NUDIX family)